MFTKKFSKMRILRKYAKWKSNVLMTLLGFLAIMLFAVGLYYIGFWGVYGVRYCYHAFVLDDLYDSYHYSLPINDDFCFYENGSHSYVRNKKSHRKVLKDISWVAGINKTDSLLCFAKDGFRGYLNQNDGKVAIPAKRYKKAWLFSEGLAAVMEKDSILKFINPKGEVIIDKQFKYCDLPDGQGYLFKNGHCPVRADNLKWGLIDKEGRWAVVPEYDFVRSAKMNRWIVVREDKQGVLDDSLHLIVEPLYKRVLVAEYGIEVLKSDYTRQLLDLNGNIQKGFMYTDVRDLYYKTKAIDPDLDEYEMTMSPYKVYQTTYSSEDSLKVGLLGPDGLPVTPPLYVMIEAINADCFRCFYDEPGHYYEGEGLSVLINRKGQVIGK